MSDYRKPAGKAPEPTYPPEPEEDRFMLAVRAQDVRFFEHQDRVFDVRFLRSVTSSRPEALYVFEVVEYRKAPWWRFWNRGYDKIATELVRGEQKYGMWDWRNASGLVPSTPEKVLAAAVRRREWLNELEAKAGKA